ncbi:MAG TPA: hypothetical protein DCS74_00020 [Veillonellaceae bacterium]|nr:hypothetical protein [Veillonellaceae bacterium]
MAGESNLSAASDDGISSGPLYQAENIVNRDFSTTGPLQKRTADVPQFNFPWGKCCLLPILDMNSHEIISYDLALSPDMEQIKRILNQAFKKFPDLKSLILHSDPGCPYEHMPYRTAFSENNIIQSMLQKGNCYDNCIMETLFDRIKNKKSFLHLQTSILIIITTVKSRAKQNGCPL